MITVSISINGEPIFTRTAVNQDAEGNDCTYLVDDGSTVQHKRTEGAVKLAIKLLKTIKEQPSPSR